MYARLVRMNVCVSFICTYQCMYIGMSACSQVHTYLYTITAHK